MGRFTAIPGVRHENIHLSRSDYGKSDPQRSGADLNEQNNVISVLIPGVGLDYQWNAYTHTFAGVHKGFSPPGAQEGAVPEGAAIPAHFLLDASVHYHVSRQVSLFATATNLSNETYLVSRRPSGLRPGMPRAFSLGVKAFL